MGRTKEAALPFLLRRHRLSTWRPMDRFVESRSRMPTERRRYWLSFFFFFNLFIYKING